MPDVTVECKQKLWIRRETWKKLKYLNRWGGGGMETKRKKYRKQNTNSKNVTIIKSKQSLILSMARSFQI